MHTRHAAKHQLISLPGPGSIVQRMVADGVDDAAIRAQLRERGFSKVRISQLVRRYGLAYTASAAEKSMARRCQVLRKKLELLRTAKPSKRQLRFILRGHKAPRRSAAASQIFVRSDVPLQQDIDQIMVETPDTIFLTVTRVGAAKLNDMAVRCLFANHAAVADVPADPESNIANFAGSEMVTEVPLRLRIFVGMRMLLTKNLNKEAGYVNGMGCKVEGMLASGIVVVTDQGRRLVVYPWTSPERVVHYPIRVGYASTLHKMQGATLDHITLWLDVPNMPAAGYVALSRVRRDADWRFIGSCNTHHFTPGR